MISANPQCEELVSDRLNWRRFVELALQDVVRDETTRVRSILSLREHGLHEKLLGLANRQLQAARRAPAKTDKTGGDDDTG